MVILLVIFLVILSKDFVFSNGVPDQHVRSRYGVWCYSEEDDQGPLPDDIDVNSELDSSRQGSLQSRDMRAMRYVTCHREHHGFQLRSRIWNLCGSDADRLRLGFKLL